MMEASLETYREALALNNLAVRSMEKGEFRYALSTQRKSLSTLHRAFRDTSGNNVEKHSNNDVVATDDDDDSSNPACHGPQEEQEEQVIVITNNDGPCSYWTVFDIYPTDENDLSSLSAAASYSISSTVLFPIYIRESPTLDYTTSETETLLSRQISIIIYNYGILQYIASQEKEAEDHNGYDRSTPPKYTSSRRRRRKPKGTTSTSTSTTTNTVPPQEQRDETRNQGPSSKNTLRTKGSRQQRHLMTSYQCFQQAKAKLFSNVEPFLSSFCHDDDDDDENTNILLGASSSSTTTTTTTITFCEETEMSCWITILILNSLALVCPNRKAERMEFLAEANHFTQVLLELKGMVVQHHVMRSASEEQEEEPEGFAEHNGSAGLPLACCVYSNSGKGPSTAAVA